MYVCKLISELNYKSPRVQLTATSVPLQPSAIQQLQLQQATILSPGVKLTFSSRSSFHKHTNSFHNMLQSVVGLLMVAMLAAAGVAMFPPQCAPEVLEEVDNPKVHEICRFLQTYADAVEQQQFKGLHVPIGLIDGGVKRQDVDHVFLRFGRRRR